MAPPALISGLLLLAASGLPACGGHAAPSAPGSPAAPASPAPPPPRRPAPGTRVGGGAALGPRSSPLGLPPAKLDRDPGRRVFPFTDQMMAAAKPGATLVLSAATVAGIEGDDLIVEGHGRPSYKV